MTDTQLDARLALVVELLEPRERVEMDEICARGEQVGGFASEQDARRFADLVLAGLSRRLVRGLVNEALAQVLADQEANPTAPVSGGPLSGP